jgi:hypothetical protein
MAGYEEFILELEQVPWFSRLGQAIDDESVERIRSWDDWPGPEDPRVERLHLDQQLFYDALRAIHPAELAGFDALVSQIVAHASQFVAYEEESDAWHAPSTAVWHAAWTAALAAHYHKVGREMPATIRDQWKWFRLGHWPAAYRAVSAEDKPEGLVVY